MFCENPNCRRTGLAKTEVERDKRLNMLLCLGCHALANPGWVPDEAQMTSMAPPVNGPPQKFGYAVTLDSFRGLSALVSFGDIGLELVVPQRTLRGFLGA